MPPPLSTSGHTGWQFQGRQQHGWFGHGTAPDQAIDQNQLEAGRADTAAYAVIGALPAADRTRYEAMLGAGGLLQLRAALPAWAASAEQSSDAFRARFFGNTVGTETADRLRGAAVAITRAATPEARDRAITTLANAISTLGVERFGRVLAQTSTSAVNPIQRVADGSAGNRSAVAAPPYVDTDPRRWLGHASVGDGECVALVRAAINAPPARTWRQGEAVQGNMSLPPRTLIATFDGNGNYNGHAALLVRQDTNGLYVVDQWNNRDRATHQISEQIAPHERVINFSAEGRMRVDIGSNYYVVR